MPDVPLQIKMLRLDLHYKNETSNSTFVSHFARNGQGKHRVFDLPQLGVQVAAIWPALKEYGSHLPIAEINVTPLTVTLRNINAEIRLATPDGISFIRLAKKEALQIRLGDVMSINETLIAVHSARQPLQPVELPAVDPRGMRLYSADMDCDTVKRSVMNNTIERFRASPRPPSYVSVGKNVQQPHPASPVATTAMPSRFGDGISSSPGDEPNETATPTASVLYSAVAEVESQEPGALKTASGAQECDTQDFEDFANIGMDMMNETTSQAYEKLTAARLNAKNTETSHSSPPQAGYSSDRKRDAEVVDDDAETASSASLEIIEHVSTSAGAVLSGAQNDARNMAQFARVHEEQRASSRPSDYQPKSNVMEPQPEDASTKASKMSTAGIESKNNSGGFELANVVDHSGDTDLDEPAPSRSLTEKPDFMQVGQDFSLTMGFSDNKVYQQTDGRQQVDSKDAVTNKNDDEDMMVNDATDDGTNDVDVIKDTAMATTTTEKGSRTITIKTMAMRQKYGADNIREEASGRTSNTRQRCLVGGEQDVLIYDSNKMQNNMGDPVDDKQDESASHSRGKQSKQTDRAIDKSPAHDFEDDRKKAKKSKKSVKRKRIESTSTNSTIELSHIVAEDGTLSTRPSRVESATKTKEATTKSVMFAEVAGMASPVLTARSARSTSSSSVKAFSDTTKTFKVFFSSATEIHKKIGERLLKKLGIITVGEVHDCDVFLVGSGQAFKRTYRSLYAIALGKVLLTDSWLGDAKSSGSLGECDKYWVVDSDKETEWGTTIYSAVARFRSGCRPFKDRTVWLSSQLQKEINKENLDSLRALLFACGAKNVLLGSPKELPSVDTIFVGTNNKKDLADASKFDLQLYSKDLLSMSVLMGNVDLTDAQYQLGRKLNVEESNGNDDPGADQPRKKRRKKA